MEDNLKKAVTEMLVLLLLRGEDMHVAQITQALVERSEGTLNIVFPYSVLYRLIHFGYIVEAYKKVAPDGRRRQYYQITAAGRAYAEELANLYQRFSRGVALVLETEGGQVCGE